MVDMHYLALLNFSHCLNEVSEHIETGQKDVFSIEGETIHQRMAVFILETHNLSGTNLGEHVQCV